MTLKREWFPSETQFDDFGSADNTQVQLTRAAPSGNLVNYLTEIHASFDTAAGVPVTASDGNGQFYEQIVQNDLVVIKKHPRRIQGQLTVTLTASGGAGNLGHLYIAGFEAPSTDFGQLY